MRTFEDIDTAEKHMARHKKRKGLLKVLLVLLLIFGIAAYFLVYLPYTRIRAKGMVLVASAREMKADFKKNDIDLIDTKLNKFSTEFEDFKKEAKTVYWASFIPYVRDFKSGIEAGDYLLHAAKEGVKAIKPHADLIGFKKGQTSFIERPAEERLQTAVATLDQVLTKVDVVAKDIEEAEKRINSIDPNRYPERIGKTEVKATIANLRQQFHGYATLFVDSKPLLKELPEIFGTEKEKTYLIMFQNIYEQRATGGFLTFYAVAKMKSGKITIEGSDDIYGIDNSIGSHPAAPDKILAYHKGVSQFYIRDSNLSPDLVKSVELFNSLYNKSSKRVDYDGIIFLDAKVLVDMLRIFGDTEAGGVRFSAENDARCDCPQVIYTLFDIVDRPVGYVKQDRKGIVGQLMYALFYKAIGFSPSKYWGILTQNMLQNLDEKHMLLYFEDPKLEAAVEKVNYAGRIKKYDGDYLHVNNVNFAGAKSNLYVKKTLISKTTFNSGAVQRQVTVEYRNPYPHSDCNLERGGLCLNATLRNWVRVYAPKGSKLIDFKGSKTKVQTYEDLDKTVFEGFLEVTPLGKAEVDVTYTLPASITEKNYSLLIQKQPGEQTEELEVIKGGTSLYKGLFDKDKEFKND
jgi:hypothetical protein